MDDVARPEQPIDIQHHEQDKLHDRAAGRIDSVQDPDSKEYFDNAERFEKWSTEAWAEDGTAATTCASRSARPRTLFQSPS